MMRFIGLIVKVYSLAVHRAQLPAIQPDQRDKEIEKIGIDC
jgi:hypothetical protein